MSQSAEAAEQIVNAATNATIKGVECISNLAGKGAMSLFTFLRAVIKEEKKTKGKARMRAFNGKPTKVFVIKKKDMDHIHVKCSYVEIKNQVKQLKHQKQEDLKQHLLLVYLVQEKHL